MAITTSFIASAATAYAVETAVFAYVGNALAAKIIGAVVGSAVGGLVGNALFGGADQAASEQFDAAARGALVNTASNVEPIYVVYGARRVGGSRIVTEVSGDTNGYLNLAFVHSEGEIQAIDAVYLNDVNVEDARFDTILEYEGFGGSDTQAASSLLMSRIPAQWTASHRGLGCAYTAMSLFWNGDVYVGLPTITADVRGRLLYDPRTSGTAYSRNPALAILDYLMHQRYGKRIPIAQIDTDSFEVAADYCDESVTVPDGSGGTTTQPRYQCDGILNPDADWLDNLRSLLSSCRGMLIFTGGKYRLILDAPAASSFAFTTDNIVGGISITLPGKRTRFNRIRARFFNPARSWQPDFAIYDNETYRTADNDLLLETEISLPYTSNYYTAMQIAEQECRQSRFGIVMEFRATLAATTCEVGDVVTVAHASYGFAVKKFRVMRVELAATDEVTVTLREYDATVYDLTLPATAREAPATNLPNSFSVGVPGNPAVTESLYQTTGSAGAKSRAAISWAAPADAFAIRYELQYKAAGDSAWLAGATTTATAANVDDLAPGSYDFRVRSFSPLGVASSWSGTTRKELVGLTAAPAAVTGFAVVNNAGLVTAAWTLHTDLDVRQGGQVVVRHSPLTSGATWNDGIIVGEFSGAAIRGLVPARSGTYLVKAVDSSGNWSTTAASATLTEAMLAAPGTVATLTEDAAFTGTKTNCAVVSSKLQLSTGTLFDSASGNFDSASGNFDAFGGQATSGTYESSTYIDATTVAARRWEAHCKASSVDNGQDFDEQQGNFDDADGYFDGAVVNDGNVALYISTTSDDPAGAPTWSGWIPWHVGEFSCRAAKFRADLSVDTPSHNIQVSELRFTCRA